MPVRPSAVTSSTLGGIAVSMMTLLGAAELRAQTLRDLVPQSASHCAVTTPPPAAGIAATPGGFLMVHPRNDAISDRYTGCKMLWIVDGDRIARLATLYFDAGSLSRVIAHDVRDASGAIEVACDVRAGRSLAPGIGRHADDSACRSVPTDELYALRLPTWPLQCLKEPDAEPCKKDPR